MIRKPGEWMTGKDDRILEVLYKKHHDNIAVKPTDIANRDNIFCSPSYIGQRVRSLTKHGLAKEAERGRYEITEKGIAYIIGAYDAENEQYIHESDEFNRRTAYERIRLHLLDYRVEIDKLIDRFNETDTKPNQ